MSTRTQTVRGMVRTGGVPALSVRANNDGTVRVRGLASTPNRDRYGEVLDATIWDGGGLRGFLLNPIMLRNHSMDAPVGRFDIVDPRPDGLQVSGVIVPGTRASDETIALVKAGVLRTFSVGFREETGAFDSSGVYHITKAELYEISIVSVPANREAVFTIDDAGALRGVKLLDEDGEDAIVRRVLRCARAVIEERAREQLRTRLVLRTLERLLTRVNNSA